MHTYHTTVALCRGQINVRWGRTLYSSQRGRIGQTVCFDKGRTHDTLMLGTAYLIAKITDVAGDTAISGTGGRFGLRKTASFDWQH